jgi:hypothetical protein
MKINIFISLLVFLLYSNAQASTVYWASWTSQDDVSAVSGNISTGSETVGLTATGTYEFAQTNGIGTNYYLPSTPYTSATVSNPPPNSNIIALNLAGTETITFSKAVVNPLIALVNWNGAVVDFGHPIQVLSSGQGYWGNGTAILNSAGTGFTGNGEFHGVIEIPGMYNSISFTDTTQEFWHGFTVGIQNVAPSSVPVPAAVWLFGSALTGLGYLGKRRKFNRLLI